MFSPVTASTSHMDAPIALELFGINHSYRYQLVRQMLIDALDGTGAHYTIEDVSQIDKFIEEGLQSVPAIRVDHDKLFNISLKEDPNATVQEVLEYIMHNKIKSIVVPTDFSDQSINAIHYAFGLAHALGLRIELMHVHHPVVDPHNAVVLDTDMGETNRIQLTRLADELQANHHHGGGYAMPVETLFEVGYPLPMIVARSRRPDVAMLVMGTLGATNILDNLFGNVSSSVASQAHCPVLLIPPDAQFSAPHKIMVAFDSELVEGRSLDRLLTFNDDFKAHLDFVHVAGKDEVFDQIRNKLMQQLLDRGDIQFSFDIREISNSHDIASQLDRYAVETNPDLLTVIARHRSFVNRMFHKSISKNLCLHTNRPTLVLHT